MSVIIKIVLGLAAVARLLFFGGAAWGAPHVSNHDLAVSVYPEEQKLSGRDVLTIDRGNATHIDLTLTPLARVSAVILDHEPLRFTFSGSTLRIDFDGKEKRAGLRLSVNYEAWFKDRLPENMFAGDNPGFGVTGIVSPEGVFLLPGANWFPREPGGKATIKITVHAPAGMEAVTEGKLLRRVTEEGVTSSDWLIDRAVEGVPLSAGPYVVTEARFGNIPVYTYFFQDSQHLARRYLDASVSYLEMYSKLIGPYAFPKFAVVENFFPTGFGFPSYTLLGRTVIQLPFIIRTSLAHEIAHCWWGNGVLVDYSSGNWSEGLATYCADYLLKEKRSPEAGKDYRRQILRDYATLAPPDKDFPLSQFTSRDSPASQVIGYGKSAMVFHMARCLTGDHNFWKALGNLYREKLFKTASWNDFALALEKQSGLDLYPFFTQWVKRPGAPFLSLGPVSSKRDGNFWKVSGRLLQKKPLFDLEVPLVVDTEKERYQNTVRSVSLDSSFSTHLEEKPVDLAVDPDYDLFRRLHFSEVPPMVNSIRGSTSLLVIAPGPVSQSLTKGFRYLLEGIGQQDAPVMEESRVAAKELKDHDILFLGLPKKKEWMPKARPGLSFGIDRFSFQGEVYSGPDDCLFVVLDHPLNPRRKAALFLPLSENAGELAAVKIGHYGKYSCLVFQGGVNRVKETWPAAASPLTRVLTGEGAKR